MFLLALGPTQSPIQWVLIVLSAAVKQQWHEASYSCPSSAKLKIARERERERERECVCVYACACTWSYTSTPHMCSYHAEGQIYFYFAVHKE
jgi:hypothetical protein